MYQYKKTVYVFVNSHRSSFWLKYDKNNFGHGIKLHIVFLRIQIQYILHNTSYSQKRMKLNFNAVCWYILWGVVRRGSKQRYLGSGLSEQWTCCNKYYKRSKYIVYWFKMLFYHRFLRYQAMWKYQSVFGRTGR